MRRRLAIAGCCLSLAAATAMFGEQGYLAIKARVAEHRIARAYAAYLEDGRAHPPWSWADTHPVARLGAPRLGVERTVLAGASGSSLAFAPGHVDGTAAPNAPGECLIAGHRDTSFRFLGDLRRGDVLWLETHGERVEYRVVSLAVRTEWNAEFVEDPGVRRLTLVTCWPVDGVLPGDERWVVSAVEMAGTSSDAGAGALGRLRRASGLAPQARVDRARPDAAARPETTRWISPEVPGLVVQQVRDNRMGRVTRFETTGFGVEE